MATRSRPTTSLVTVAFILGASCTPSGECEWETWDGPCILESVGRVRVVEQFPRSYVVLEALYKPADASSIGAPPTVRVEHNTDARYEYDLTQHLKRYDKTRCAVRVRDEAVCGSPEMTAAIPAYQPRLTVETRATGCAMLDDRESQGSAVSEPLEEVLEFPEGTAATNAELLAAASRVATKLTNDPAIQCVAISGQNAYGEEFRLADERARAVQQMLIQRGVAAERLRVFAAVLPTYAGTSAMERVSDPEHRRVQLTVVVRQAAR